MLVIWQGVAHIPRSEIQSCCCSSPRTLCLSVSPENSKSTPQAPTTFVKMDFHKEDAEVASKSSSQPLLSPDEFYYDRPQKPARNRTHLLWITHAIYLAAITGLLAFFLFTPSSTSAIDCARQENAWCQ